MKKYKRILSLAIAFIIIFAAGCSSKITNTAESTSKAQPVNNGSTYPMTIKDYNNRSVTIDKEPVRVISIAPNITETIYALGMGSKLIGRTDFCTYPEEVKNVASIGYLDKPNIEKITELKPDIVIASNQLKEDADKKLAELGIKVIVISGEESFEGVYQVIEKTGQVLNARAKADEIVAGMKKKIQEVEEKVKGKNKPVAYYVVDYGKAQFTAGKDTFIGKMLEMAGAKNAADDVTGWSYSLEKLVEKNPDIMICSKYFDAKKGIQSTNGYKDLKAVKENKLYEIDNDMLDRQGPRLADGLLELAKIVHPEAFK